MKNQLIPIIVLLAGMALLAPSPSTGAPVNNAEPDWWLKPQRMIQTNMREIDATMDVPAYVASLKAAGANVVLFNVGGIVANYPTELPFHYRNPFMRGDLVGEVVQRLHAEGIRVVARFDFSKVNESIATAHPDWLTRSADGQSIPPYNGQVSTCLNGWYQQEGMLKILGEAFDRYPLDGVFFNSIGYLSRDYSGQQGKVLGAPIPIHDVTVQITPASPVTQARLLKSGKPLPVQAGVDGTVSCIVPLLNTYEVVLFEY